MIKKALTLLVLIFSTSIFSQNNFEPGYYIDNIGVKKNCLIKNIDWKYNPKEIDIKIDNNSPIENLSIDKISEFSIENKSKYIRAFLEIEQSSDNLQQISSDPNFIFKNETVFLKILVEGSKSNLYFLENDRVIRFFYDNNEKITPLLNKIYKNENGDIATKAYFKQQLYSTLNCEINKIPAENLKYTSSSLSEYFEKVNNCNEEKNTSINYDKKKSDKNYLKLLLNSNFYKLNLNNINNKNESFLGYGIGIEYENYFKFNNYSWSYSSQNTINYLGFNAIPNNKNENEFKIKDYFIRSSNGINKYFYINNKNSILISGGLNLDYHFTNAKFRKNTNNDDIDLITTEKSNYLLMNFYAGLGYKFERFQFEIKTNTKHNQIKSNILFNLTYIIK